MKHQTTISTKWLFAVHRHYQINIRVIQKIQMQLAQSFNDARPHWKLEAISRLYIYNISNFISKYNHTKIFTEAPSQATEKIFFTTRAVHERDPAEIKITWNQYNLTSNTAAVVQISLWGYRETTIKPELEYINTIEVLIIIYSYKVHHMTPTPTNEMHLLCRKVPPTPARTQ